MQLFYAPDIATNPLLPEEESRHCTKVLRLTVDDTLMLTDGKGSFYRAVIAEPHPKYCRVTVVEHLPQAPLWPFRIHLAVAPTKNIDRSRHRYRDMPQLPLLGTSGGKDRAIRENPRFGHEAIAESTPASAYRNERL